MVRERLRTAIEASQYSQHSFSRIIGVATPNLNAFLKGTRSLPYKKFIVALDELNLTVGPKASGASIVPPIELPVIFRQAIENAGMKIKDVAEESKIDLAGLSTFLNGSRTMPIRNIEKLMNTLDYDFVKFIKPKCKKTA